MSSIRIVIPTRNAEQFLPFSLPMLTAALPAQDIWILDSASQDRTVEIARDFDVKLHSIPQSSFNHGGTRNLGRQLAGPEAEILLYLTQDAIPANGHFLAELLAAFADPQVGIAYGRQLPVPGASPLEAFPRLFNYPTQSLVKSQQSLPTLGIKTFFCSDSFCAYRVAAWEAVGGFPDHVIVGEDQYIGARMIEQGYKIAYAATAEVYHSHSYTLWEEFQRYFDTGVFFSQQQWLLALAGQAEGEGLKFLSAQTAYLWESGRPLLIPYSLLLTLAKYLGYRVGMLEARLPKHWKMRFSQQKYFWQNSAPKTP
jgi:rhamnosyltransferase